MTNQNTVHKVRLLLLLTTLCAPSTLAFAQGSPAESTPAEAPAGAPSETPPPPPAPADAVVPLADMAPSDAAPAPNLSDVAAKTDALEEQFSATKAVVDTLAKIKVSGYIQGRLGLHENSAAGVVPQGAEQAGTATIFDRFYVRRGRLKVTYAGNNA